MTAICFDGKMIAADRLATRGNVRAGYRKKIETWTGGVFATAGNYGDEDLFRQWLENGARKSVKLGKKFSALYTENGKVYHVGSDLKPYETFAPHGIGTGGEACEVLIREGYTAEEAVKAVSKFNTTVGGKVDTYIV